uniref:Uncharacterized protein n=1 Tax=Arundo donax TaxID=35708 RepID=A0A0A9BMR3_ARUDO
MLQYFACQAQFFMVLEGEGSVWMLACGHPANKLALTTLMCCCLDRGQPLARPRLRWLTHAFSCQLAGETRSAESSTNYLACRWLAGIAQAQSKRARKAHTSQTFPIIQF